MGMLENHRIRDSAKEDLLEGLVSGNIPHQFEVLREFTSHEGGRNIVGNSLSTAFFIPWIIAAALGGDTAKKPNTGFFHSILWFLFLGLIMHIFGFLM